MEKDKTALVEQMKKQRFLPITEETFQIYRTYSSLIDSHNPDEISHLLFYEGECYFRLGKFNEALSRLTRCLQAPKKNELKYLDALSYNTIGLIYSYLGQETISINNLLQCRFLSEDMHYERELSVCCLNLGILYNQLEDYDTSLKYYDLAYGHVSDDGFHFFDLKMFSQTFRGIVYCKMGELEKALAVFRQIQQLKPAGGNSFYDASILNLSIRLHDLFQDKDLLHDNLNQLSTLVTSDFGFLQLSGFYFDVCSYLLEKHLQNETLRLLECIRPSIEQSSLVFLQYNYQNYQIAYFRTFAGKNDYLQACSRLIGLHPAYLEEQRYAKLYSLEYVERLRQTKNDSEMYREKSRLDQMTGLLNKYTIQFLIEEDLSAPHHGEQSAMILIDLDHFKQINDTLGHLAGDNFICQTASIIQNYFEDNALCGRIGGDEFLVYISSVPDISFVVLQTEILRQEIFRQASERNITVTTQASIGIAFSSEYCYDYEGLFLAADSALYRAKTSGRNKVIVAD